MKIINRTRVRLIIVQEKVQEDFGKVLRGLRKSLEGFCKTFGKVPPPAGANSREAADAWKQSREKRNLHDASLPPEIFLQTGSPSAHEQALKPFRQLAFHLVVPCKKL